MCFDKFHHLLSFSQVYPFHNTKTLCSLSLFLIPVYQIRVDHIQLSVKILDFTVNLPIFVLISTGKCSFQPFSRKLTFAKHRNQCIKSNPVKMHSCRCQVQWAHIQYYYYAQGSGNISEDGVEKI